MRESILKRLACFTYELKIDDVPKEVIKHAKICVMDALECCISSEDDNRKSGAFDSIEKGVGFPCTLYGRKSKASASDAAFYNTVSGAISYRNDISIIGKGHPGSITIPTVLAVAEKYRLSGRRTLEAIIVGYEIMIRFGAMLGCADFPYAFRPTAFVAPVGAAFAAGKALGLDVEQLVSAGSFAFNCASGLNQWADDGTGEDVIQNGWGARNGILCAELARSGVLGAPNAVEGGFGFLKAYGIEEFGSVLYEKLGEEFFLCQTQFKQIPACMNVQNAAQIADSIAKKDGFEASNVGSVLIEMTKGGKEWPNGDKKNVETLIHAAMSVPFAVAQTLITGDCDKVCFAPPYSDETRRMISKCEVVAKPEYTAIQKQHQVVGITVTMNDGTVFSEERLDARTLSEDEAVAKFEATVGRVYGKEASDRMSELLMELENLEDVLPVLSMLE